MKTIAKTLEVSRSNLIERCKQDLPLSLAPSAKKADQEVLESIRKIIGERPMYGYPRVTAMLRKERKEEGKSALNHKRVYHIMRENNLTLTKNEGRRTLTHEMKFIATSGGIDGSQIMAPKWSSLRV